MKNLSENKRAALLQAALTLFTEHGFHGTPTSKIAKEAGVATGTLFHYFGTKEELINQLYLGIKQDLGQRLVEGVHNEPTLRSKIRKIWLNFVVWSLENSKKLLFFNQFSSSPYISNLTRDEATLQLRFLHNLIEEGQRQEVLKQMPAEMLFDISTGMAQVMSMHFLQHPEHFQDDVWREMAFTAYWDCIRR